MNFNTGIVEVTGLCNPDDVTEVISQYPYWLQMNIPETLSIPPQKPDMETINSLNITVDIIRAEVIKVPVSPTNASGELIPNLEGKVSTGRKIIVEGQLCQQIFYTANVAEQSVHSAHFYVPFSAYIVVPQIIEMTNNATTPATISQVDSLNINFQVAACVEDAVVTMVDERTLTKQITLLVYAIPGETI